MNQQDVLDRLREELNIPFFDGKIEDKEYSEEEYQKLKADLQNYFEQYVRECRKLINLPYYLKRTSAQDFFICSDVLFYK
ncbi:hypothetical protein I8F73_03740 [Enterococcus faecalis]|nr:hypothetical protein [Enterococcus faecalis]